MIPESIKKFRPRNTEIHAKNGHYYVYEVKAFYDKETGKSKRKSLGCIGQIYEGVGFVSNKKRNEDVTVTVKEFGATWLFYSLTQDVKSVLRSYFGFNGLKLYAAAILKLLPNFSFYDLSRHYSRSYISELIPRLDFSYESVVNMLEDFGGKSWSGNMLFRELAGDEWKKGTTVFCKTIFLKDRNAYKLGSKSFPCIAKNRILYAYDRDTKSVVFYRTIPEGMSVADGFADTEARLERKNDVLVFERSNWSKKDIDEIAAVGGSFIIPVGDDRIPDPTMAWDGSFTCESSKILYKETPDGEKTKIVVFYDEETRLRHLVQYLNAHDIEVSGMAELASRIPEDARTAHYGYSAFVVSSDLAPEDVFKDSLVRSRFKTLYQNMNVCPEIDMEKESKVRICEGWSFLNYIAYVIYFRVLGAINRSGLAERYSMRNLISMGETVSKCRLNGVWHTTNLDDEKNDIFGKLGIPIN